LQRELEGKRSPSEPVIMEMLSSEYGWTPNEIKELSISDLNNYLKIIALRRSIEKARSK